MREDPSKKSPTKVGSDPQTLEEDIRRRAYELYEARGREEGHDFDDWLRAEEEITKGKGRTVAA